MKPKLHHLQLTLPRIEPAKIATRQIGFNDPREALNSRP
jgi:hypothetical protein